MKIFIRFLPGLVSALSHTLDAAEPVQLRVDFAKPDGAGNIADLLNLSSQRETQNL